MKGLPWYPERKPRPVMTSQVEPDWPVQDEFDPRNWREILRDLESVPVVESMGETRVVHEDGLVYLYSPHGNSIMSEDMWRACVTHPEIKKAFDRLESVS